MKEFVGNIEVKVKFKARAGTEISALREIIAEIEQRYEVLGYKWDTPLEVQREHEHKHVA